MNKKIKKLMKGQEEEFKLASESKRIDEFEVYKLNSISIIAFLE